MSKLLEKRNAIYGICAVWIMLFHVFRRIGMPYIPVLTNIAGIGNMAVDVFFFFSGLCLSLSVEKRDYKRNGWSSFYKRRIVRILIPYLIICIPYYLWNAAYEVNGSAEHKLLVFAANLSSASFWLRGTQTTWYVYGIAVFYLLFPYLHSVASGMDRKKKGMLLIGCVGFAVLTAFVPLLRNSTLVWARLPIFTIGVLMGIRPNMGKLPQKQEIIASILVLIVLGWLTSFSEISASFTIPQVFRFLLYTPMTLSLMCVLSIVNGKRNIFERIGGFSLEIYLVHITLLHPLKYYGLVDMTGYWLYLILPAITLPVAALVAKIEQEVLSKNPVK